jgi:hypothetical protein
LSEDELRADVRSLIEKRISLERFKDLYYERGWSTHSIAESVSLSKSTVWRYMKRHSLKRRLSRYRLSFDQFSQLDLAYFAGLFDGEGNITVTIGRGRILRVEISLVNTDKRVLRWRRFFTHNTLRHNMGFNHNSTAYVLYTHNFKDAHALLCAILPYLKLKRRRAELMIKLCESRMNRFRQPPSSRELRLIALIRSLNSRKGKRK